eukprot:SAG25_NODE_91_length_16078_cov_7.663058_3_plen_74_part_00
MVATNLTKLYTPLIASKEIRTIRSEVMGQVVGTQWDATTRQGQAICVVNRWCSDSMELKQRLTMLKTAIASCT